MAITPMNPLHMISRMKSTKIHLRADGLLEKHYELAEWGPQPLNTYPAWTIINLVADMLLLYRTQRDAHLVFKPRAPFGADHNSSSDWLHGRLGSMSDSSNDNLLDVVLQAHGGLDLFNRIEKVDISVNISGLLWDLKGYPGHRLVSCVVDPKHSKVTYLGLDGGQDDTVWAWTPQKVWKEAADGSIMASRENARDSFNGHELNTPWDNLHLLYFSGYAIYNYICAPFCFTWEGFSSREIDPYIENGQQWRVLEVIYPPRSPTHCRTQEFCYDDHYRLRRMDYYAEVVGGSKAAHYCYDHRNIDGLVFPMLRRVVTIPAGIEAGGPTSVLLDFHSYKVTYTDVGEENKSGRP